MFQSPVAVILNARASKPKPRIVQMPSAAPGTVPGTLLPAQGTESIRYSENIKAYPIGRYVDPNNNLIMHERHTIYRVEITAKWNLHPSGPGERSAEKGRYAQTKWQTGRWN